MNENQPIVRASTINLRPRCPDFKVKPRNVPSTGDWPWLNIDVWCLLSWVQIPVKSKSQTNPSSNRVLWVLLRIPAHRTWVICQHCQNQKSNILSHICKHDRARPCHHLGSASCNTESFQSFLNWMFVSHTSRLRRCHWPVSCWVFRQPELSHTFVAPTFSHHKAFVRVNYEEESEKNVDGDDF